MEATKYYSLQIEGLQKLDAILNIDIPVENIPQVIEEPDVSSGKTIKQVLVVLGIVTIGISVYWGYRHFKAKNKLREQESE